MAFRPVKSAPEFADLKIVLAQTRQTEDPLYQVVQEIIERLSRFQFTDSSTITSGDGGGGIPGTTFPYVDLKEGAYGNPPTDTERIYALDVNGYTQVEMVDSVGHGARISSDNIVIAKITQSGGVTRGQPVFIAGASGANSLVQLAKADNINTMPAIGIVLDAGANNAFTRVLVSGTLQGVNTSAFAEGVSLFISPITAGGFTTILPVAPSYAQRIGFVTRSHATQGEILVLTTGVLADPRLHHTTHEPGGTDPMAVDAPSGIGSLRTLGTAPLQAAPGVHANYHRAIGSDPVVITTLAGYPNNINLFLRGDGTFATPPPPITGGIPGAHADTHSIGGTDPLINNAWTNQPNIFTQDQLISKIRPDLQLQHQGDTSKSHLQVVIPSNFAITNDLFYNGTNWMKDDTTIQGTLVNIVNGGFNIYTSPAGPNPASLTQILSISPSGNLTIPGSISAAGGLAPGPHHSTHEPGGSDVLVNVAWLNLRNSFTKEQTILNEAGDVVARFALMNMTNPLNQRKWLFWAYTDFLGIGQFFDDESGGQPSFEFHRDGRFIVPGQLQAAGIGTTPVADSNLSTNVALRNVDNNFVAQTLASNSRVNGNFYLQTGGVIHWSRTGLPVDTNKWQEVGAYPGDGSYRLYPVNDDETIVQSPGFVIDRAGNFSFSGSMTAGSIPTARITGILPDAQLSANVVLKPINPADLPATIAYKNIDNAFTVSQTLRDYTTISGNLGLFRLIDTSGPANAQRWRFLQYSDGVLRLESLPDNESSFLSRLSFMRDGGLDTTGNIKGGNITAITDIYEKNRSTPVGHWIGFTPSLSASAGGIGLNNQLTAQYTLIGKTMSVAIYLNISISASPLQIFLNIPGGFVAASNTLTVIYVSVGSTGTATTGAAITTSAGSNQFSITLQPPAGFLSGNQWIAGTITFPIQ